MEFIKLNKENTPIYTLNSISFYKMSSSTSNEEEIYPEASPGLTYTISEDGTYASFSGVEETWVAGSELVVSNTYNGLPVKEIAGIITNYDSTTADITSVYLPKNMEMVQTNLIFAKALNISVGNNIKKLNLPVDSPYFVNPDNCINNVVYLSSRDKSVVYAMGYINIDNAESLTITIDCSHLCKLTHGGIDRAVELSRNVRYICDSAICDKIAMVGRLTIPHFPEDKLEIHPDAFKSKDSAYITIYHRNHPSVLNYDFAAKNVTATLIELTD